MCVMRKDPGAALVVRFATSLVFWSDARPIRHRAHAYVSLEGALEGPDVPKTGGERCPDNRVVMSTHQLHRTAHARSEEHTSELQSPCNLVCRLLLEKKKSTYSCLSTLLQLSVTIRGIC